MEIAAGIADADGAGGLDAGVVEEAGVTVTIQAGDEICHLRSTHRRRAGNAIRAATIIAARRVIVVRDHRHRWNLAKMTLCLPGESLAKYRGRPQQAPVEPVREQEPEERQPNFEQPAARPAFGAQPTTGGPRRFSGSLPHWVLADNESEAEAAGAPKVRRKHTRTKPRNQLPARRRTSRRSSQRTTAQWHGRLE